MAIGTNRTMVKENLKKLFGYDNFRSVQQEHASHIVLKGKNDVYLNLQPGDGKSLCFQLPAILKTNKVTVVFVPTHTLAKDQILFLERKGIKADLFIWRKKKERQDTMHYIQSMISSAKMNQFLYVLVDKRSVDLVKDYIIQLNQKNMLSYIVFDEAHCASSLSHDYVPAYRDVAMLVNETCPNICKIASTATATTEVRRDVISKLNMKDVIKIRSSTYNLTVYHDVYFIDTIPKPLEHLMEFIDKALQSKIELPEVNRYCGLIFCRKIQVVKSIVEYLKTLKIPAEAYHGDLKIHQRDGIHKKWTNGEIPILVTTREFGIGLHKPNVKFVVHWNLPLSIQQLYQESERISQCQKKAYCRVYYSYVEEENIRTYINSLPGGKLGERSDYVARKLHFFEDVINYCLQIKCRHVARYWACFEQIVPACGSYCDACGDRRSLRSRVSEFLKCRESMKKALVDKLARIPVIPTVKRVNIKATTTEKQKSSSTSYVSIPLKRKQSYNRLFHELMENYMKTREELEKDIKESDIAETARWLENSLFIGSRSCTSYNRDIVLAVLKIRRSTESGFACSHLKYFKAKEMPIFDLQPKVVIEVMEIDDADDDDVVPQKEPVIDDHDTKVDPVITATKVPELVDLASDSSCESVTP